MSQEIDLEGKSQYSHTIDRSTLRDSSASYPQKEKVDVYCELEVPLSGPLSPSETVYRLHAQDDFPDGGLRAWLVVLGVRSLLFPIASGLLTNYISVFMFSFRNVNYSSLWRFFDRSFMLIVSHTDLAM
jgi:hypothetical protein